MRTRRWKLPSFACLMVLLTISTYQTYAQNLVSAKVLSADGPVEIRRDPQGGAKLKKVNFKPYDQLKAGDRIITGWQGRLVLGLSDGSQAIVGENTVVDVKDLGSSPRELFNVLRGKTRVHIERLGGRPNPYRINTPTAVIAVRGTLFDVIVRTNETEVFVHEGEVAVSSLLAPEGIVLLTTGQMTRVRRGELPASPAPFKPGRNDDSFRRVPDTRTIDNISELLDASEERRLRNQRTATPVDRQNSNAPAAPARGPGRRP
ncbi:MAG: FecR family protein [Pyrinomonadaceae bacterium]